MLIPDCLKMDGTCSVCQFYDWHPVAIQSATDGICLITGEDRHLRDTCTCVEKRMKLEAKP